MLSMLEVVRIFLDLLDAEGWLLYVKEIRNLQARFYDCCILYISYHLLLLISDFFLSLTAHIKTFAYYIE